MQEAIERKPPASQSARNIVFDSVELQGFGSFGFRRAVRYPLHGRGVVLVMGKNEDDACADSNGAGKTTLCMAALWALTGSADVRADGKRLGRKDIVHSLGGDAGTGGRDAAVDADGDADLCDQGEGKPQGKSRRAGVGAVLTCLRIASCFVALPRRQPPAARPCIAPPTYARVPPVAGSHGSASVCLRGMIDGVDFEVRRRMSGGRNDAHSLRVTLGGLFVHTGCLHWARWRLSCGRG